MGRFPARLNTPRTTHAKSGGVPDYGGDGDRVAGRPRRVTAFAASDRTRSRQETSIDIAPSESRRGARHVAGRRRTTVNGYRLAHCNAGARYLQVSSSQKRAILITDRLFPRSGSSRPWRREQETSRPDIVDFTAYFVEDSPDAALAAGGAWRPERVATPDSPPARTAFWGGPRCSGVLFAGQLVLGPLPTV